MIVHVLYWSKGNICPLQSLFFLEDYIIQVIPPHPPFKKTVSYRGTQAGLELPTTPTSVLSVLDTMMDFQMTANICKTLAPGNLLQNWSFFTPDSWTQMTFSSFPDRWELLRSWQWERISQWLVVLGELPSTVKEGVSDVSVGRELPVVIAGFSFWPGMDCSRQQTKQRFFPSCVSLAQSSCLYACWASWWCEVKMADKPPRRAAHHSSYYELRTEGTTQREIEAIPDTNKDVPLSSSPRTSTPANAFSPVLLQTPYLWEQRHWLGLQWGQGWVLRRNRESVLCGRLQ